MSEPLVSVVVSTYNRAVRLEQLLDSLRDQRLSADEFEVIVVDDCSEPATGAVLARESKRAGLNVRSIRHDIALGPAAGRNSGWRLARAPLVAFTDDDCVADPGWLSAGLRAHAEQPDAVLQGVTRPNPRELTGSGPLWHTVQVDSLGPQYEACNIFYPRELLVALGGFDERFGPRTAGEDTDLAWRAIDRGTRTALAEDALVFHAVEQVRVPELLRAASRWGEVAGVIAAHPDTRSMLYRGVFWNVWHYLLWRSLLGLAAPRWLRMTILVRHALELHARAGRRAGSARLIPFLLAYDALECWSIARGAIRHRTLVL